MCSRLKPTTPKWPRARRVAPPARSAISPIPGVGASARAPSASVPSQRGRLKRVTLVVLAMLAVVTSFQLLDRTTGNAPIKSGLPWQSSSLPNTSSGIHVALPFDYRTTPTAMAGKVGYVWGSEWPGAQPQVYRSLYLPYDRDENPRDYSAAHDLAWWQANHPDWIEYRCDRRTPAFEFGQTANVPLDITNPAVLAYVENTYIIPALGPAGGYQGIGFDNPDFRNAGDWTGQRCGHYDAAGHWVQQFNGTSNDPAYRSAILTWEQIIYQWMHAHFPSATMAVNFSYDPAFAADSLQMLRYLDIDIDEQGFTNGNNGPPWQYTDGAWQANMQALEFNAGLGHGLFSINQEPVAFSGLTTAEVQWALANYLLVKNQASFLYICGTQEYGSLFLRPEYNAPIGTPVGTMRAWQSVFVRYFSQGMAIVNPSSTAWRVVRLPATYHDLYGHTLRGSLRLAPASGLVLLDA